MEKVKNIFSNVINWVKSHLILLVAIIAAILVVVIVANLFIKTPKKVVKAYIKAFDNMKVSKIMKLSDYKAQNALVYSSLEDFKKSDYNDFKDAYDKIDNDDIDKDKIEKALDKSFDKIKDDYKSFNCKIAKIKSVEKITNDFSIIKAEVRFKAKPEDKDDDRIDEIRTITFAVYKNKVASGMSTMF